ncbi:MAG: phosphoesterase [Thermoproteota archaeon]|nr:MAG: phosphoesterase [Candidatus Korarchaeota archaeon]RLG53522.1 MAG: phosphoesterase [Candidatus Korarchaeota archaeon]
MTFRMFFAADIHGNTIVWRKWLNAVNVYNADVIILAGDLTGKAIVPIVDYGDRYETTLIDQKLVARSSEELEKIKERIEGIAYYYVILTKEELQDIAQSPKKQEELFKKVMVERLEKWLNLLVEKVDLRKTTAIVMPGNDDEKYIDETIKRFEDRGVIYPLDKTVELPYGYQVISHEYVNPTPWNTPREAPEDKLEKMLRKKIEKSGVKDFKKALFNFHCPPWNTKLDLAPKLDKNLKPVYVGGRPVLVHVGSRAVRKLEEEYQPLMGLHGHIHESYASDKIGDTIVINPGSEYSEGLLRGFIIEFEPDGLKTYWKIEG